MICDYRWCDEVGGLDAAVAVPADGRYSNKRLGLDRRNLDFRIIVKSLFQKKSEIGTGIVWSAARLQGKLRRPLDHILPVLCKPVGLTRARGGHDADVAIGVK